ncbi:MAG: hypothetical protein Q8K89_04180 [Actinomycetota bacterium]|nr:hypothetical protein [Actinomycetota bacterium]
MVSLLLLFVLAGVCGCSCSSPIVESNAAVSKASPEEQSVQVAESDIERLQSRDYAASYEALSAADRGQVTSDEWIRRCQEVEAMVGEIEGYRILGSRWLDTGRTVVAVDVEIDFSDLDGPHRSTLFYEMLDGVPVQTMLWGRDLELAGVAQ